MVKLSSIFQLNTIPPRQLLPTFLTLSLPLIAFLGLLFYLHTEESIRHDTLLLTAQHEGRAQTPSLLEGSAFQEELARKSTLARRFHLFLYLSFLAGALPLFWWLTLLLKSAQENKKRLVAQEQQFRQLYENAPLPYQSLDVQGRILTVNQSWLAVMGYDRSEVIGRDFVSFVAPSSLADFQEIFTFRAQPGDEKECGCELELVKKDGSTLTAAFRSEFLLDASGDCSQAQCIFTDITRLAAEKRYNAHLRILLETIIHLHRVIGQATAKPDLIRSCCDLLVNSRGYAGAWIILFDREGKCEFSAESGLRHDIVQLRGRIDLGNPPPCIQKRRDGQKIVTINTPPTFCRDCPMANGYPRSGLMCASLEHTGVNYGFLNVSLPHDSIQDHEEQERFGEIADDIGYALFNLDEQQKKLEMETRLRQSEARLRGITDAAKDAILMIDAQGAITYWNPAAAVILGYHVEEVMGRNLQTLLTPALNQDAGQDAFAEFVRVGCGNGIGKNLELTVCRKDGREIPAALSLSTLFLDGAWQAVGILRDISDQKRMEEQMLQSEKMAIIAGLAAGVAHEINTPLSAILQSIQVIRQGLSPALARNQEIASQCGVDLVEVHDYFERREINFFMDGIRDSAIKSGKIITNLLQFSRPEKMAFDMADLALLLEKSVELTQTDYILRKQYARLHVEFVREYAPQLPLVLCVAIEIEQVFINVLKNAVQAMEDRAEPRPDPRLVLRTRQQGEMIRVEIEDNGVGMNEATRRRIFDPFFTTRDVGVGAGLGLSVAYTIIVTKHGGRLTSFPRPDRGQR